MGPARKMAHGLGTVHGRTAAKGDQRLGRGLLHGPHAPGHQSEGRVGRNLVKQRNGTAGQAGLYLFQQTGLMGQKPIRDYHDPLSRQSFQSRKGVFSKVNCGPQQKLSHGHPLHLLRWA